MSEPTVDDDGQPQEVANAIFVALIVKRDDGTV
jgi:hypothetical protein